MTLPLTRAPERSPSVDAADRTGEEERQPLAEVENLRISFGDREVVRGISFSAHPGRCLAIVGESGSGKSVTARTLVGLTGRGSEVRADRLELGGRQLAGLKERQWREIRGREVGFVLQDALVSLDQLRLVGQEIAEPLRLHDWGDRTLREARVIELLEQVGVPEPEVKARQRPYELSGGLRQRALIASALALDPRLIVADEPTTALDVTVQAQVLDLLAATKARGTGIILISHDLAVVARLADEVAVMRDGEIVEHGPAQQVLNAPQHDYTRALLDAIPSEHTRGTRLVRPADGSALPPRVRVAERPSPTSASPAGEVTPVRLLEARDLVKRYRGPDGIDRTVVDRVSLHVGRGETLGIVGESGSGKTTTAKMALAMLEPDEGEVFLRGEPWSGVGVRRRRGRRRHIGVVYQDPLSSFDPRWSVGRILADALGTAVPARSGSDARDRAVQLLEQVGLEARHLGTTPLRLSGGQRQRVAIARALAPEPELIVCDEPVSALDVSVQAQVLDLLTDLQDRLGVSYLFISHDLGVIHHMSDRLMVMKDGRVVEEGLADDVFRDPSQAYTRELLTALPRLSA